MGVRILKGEDYACWYCSTSMWAFGPVFEDEFQADDFLQWIEGDPRSYSDALLESKYVEFLEEKEAIEKQEKEDAENEKANSEAG